MDSAQRAGKKPNRIGCLMGHMTWQIARSVPVLEIFRHYLGYEGSPGLWHLLLAMLAKMHVTYEGIHWVSGLIAVGTSLLLIFLAPFPLWIRFILPFTYFLVPGCCRCEKPWAGTDTALYCRNRVATRIHPHGAASRVLAI
jgi:hypothetical protein